MSLWHPIAIIEFWNTLIMPLRSLSLPVTLDTSSANMAADFYAPALAVSVGYDRGVGFFSSGWLRMVAQGMTCEACGDCQ